MRLPKRPRREHIWMPTGPNENMCACGATQRKEVHGATYKAWKALAWTVAVPPCPGPRQLHDGVAAREAKRRRRK